MSLQEAKDEIARNYNRRDWNHLFSTRTHNGVSCYSLLEEAAELYAKSKWEQACYEMRLEIIGQWNPNAGEFDSINDTIEPEFKP
jgi:hypothetical protein